jgi:hypothetical protein
MDNVCYVITNSRTASVVTKLLVLIAQPVIS